MYGLVSGIVTWRLISTYRVCFGVVVRVCLDAKLVQETQILAVQSGGLGTMVAPDRLHPFLDS